MKRNGVKGSKKEISCYSVFNLKNQTIIWTLEEVERLFFKVDTRRPDFIKFGESEEYLTTNYKPKPKIPKKIFAIKVTKEQVQI